MGRSKRQTRLAFNPLPTSSSPAGKELGEKAFAHVGYEGSPRQTRRKREAADDDPVLPTPGKSSQLPARISQIQTDAADDETATSPTTRTKKRGAQGKLNFSNHIGVRLSPSDIDLDEGKSQRSSSGSSTSEEEMIMRNKTPAKRKRGGFGIFPSQKVQIIEDDDSGDELSSSKSRAKSTRSRRDEDADVSPRLPRRSLRINLVEKEDDEDEIISPLRNGRRNNQRKSSVIQLSDGEPETSGDDAPELYTSPAQQKKARHVVKAKKSYKERGDDFVVDDEGEDMDDFEVGEEPVCKSVRPKARSNRRQEDAFIDDGSEPDVEEEAEQESRRPKKLRRRKSRHMGEREKEELDDDLADLNSSPPGAKFQIPLKKADPKKDALAALKAKRAGIEPSSSAVHVNGATIISDDEEEAEVAYDEEAEYEDAAEARRRGALDEEDEADDFIDDDGQLGVETDFELPMYLRGLTRMKPKELFRYAVEWMVQKKLNPAFNQDKEKYDITFQRLDDEVRGLAGSKYKSSAWTRDFTISLEARPEIEVIEIGAMLYQDKCQACNRSGHPATFQIRFTGRPYNPKTLEPLEQEGDDEEDLNSDASDSLPHHEEYDHKSRLVPPASRTYHVGRFCKDNATTAHALEHWKFSLNSWIVDWLEDQGHLEDAKIVKRDRWDEPRRRKYANRVVEEMGECGEIRELYRAFRAEVDGAREARTGWERRLAGDY